MDSQPEVFDYFLPFKLASKIIKALGFWHDENSSMLYRVYGIVFHLTVIEFLWILQVVYLFTMADNVKDISFVLGGLITFTAISSKTLTFMYQLPKIKKLLQMLEELHHLTQNEQNSEKIKLKYQVTGILKVYKTFLSICVLTALPGLYTLIFNYHPREIPYKLWIPVDYKHNDFWFIGVAIYLISGPALSALIEATLDTFPVMFISFGTGLLEELCERINNIVTDIDDINEQPGPSHNKLTKFQKVVRREQTQKKHLKELLKCIEIHQEIQKFLTHTSEIFSTMIFVQGMCCSINMCTTAFQLSMVNHTTIKTNYIN